MEKNSSETIITNKSNLQMNPIPNFQPRTFGILDIDPNKIKEPPHFTEPATLEAMVNLGIVSSDLVEPNINDFKNQDPNVANEIREQMEQRRLATIQRIIIERQNVLRSMKGIFATEKTEDKKEKKSANKVNSILNKNHEQIIKPTPKNLSSLKSPKSQEHLLSPQPIGLQKLGNLSSSNLLSNDSYNNAERSLEQKLLEITSKYNNPIAPAPIENVPEVEEIASVGDIHVKKKRKGHKLKKSKTVETNLQPKSKIPMPKPKRRKKRVNPKVLDNEDNPPDTIRRVKKPSLMEMRARKACETKERTEAIKRNNALRALSRVDSVEKRQNELRMKQQELIREKARIRMERLAKLEQQNEEKWNNKKKEGQDDMKRKQRAYQKIREKEMKKYEAEQKWRMKKIYGTQIAKKNKKTSDIENLRKKLIASKLSLQSNSQEHLEIGEQQKQGASYSEPPSKLAPEPIKDTSKRPFKPIYKPQDRIRSNTSKEKGLTYFNHAKSNAKPLVPEKGSRIPYLRQPKLY